MYVIYMYVSFICIYHLLCMHIYMYVILNNTVTKLVTILTKCFFFHIWTLQATLNAQKNEKVKKVQDQVKDNLTEDNWTLLRLTIVSIWEIYW